MEKQNMNLPSPTPTTFVQADTATFRDLVQKHTGSAAGKYSQTKLPSGTTAVRRSPFKLQERRNTSRKLEIQLGLTSLPRQIIRSPVTPLRCDSVFSAGAGNDSPAAVEEEKAISEKRFYLYPSPMASEPPELLTLFPLTSPFNEGTEELYGFQSL